VQLGDYVLDVGSGKFKVPREKFVKEDTLAWRGGTEADEPILRKEVHEKIGRWVGGR
jgi:hypothetical protein